MIGDMHPFVAAVDETLRRHRMVGVGETVLIGVSGGPDSMALLHTLVALQPKWSIRLVVCHLNHGLRKGASEREAAFVREVATALGLSCHVGERDVSGYCKEQGISVQEGAREVRYAFYAAEAERCGADRVALGHQADDNAETVLMHLLRGTGPRGLAGIPPVRQGWIIRPLIEVSRRRVMAFLDEHGLVYVEDPSNSDLRYLRNRVRHKLLPFLERSFGFKAVPGLTGLVETIRDEEDFWNHQVAAAFQRAVMVQQEGRVVLSRPCVRALHPALLRRTVRHAIGSVAGGLRGIGRRHVALVTRLMNRSGVAGAVDLPLGVRVSCGLDRVDFSRGVGLPVKDFSYSIGGPGEVLLEELGMRVVVSVSEPGQVSGRLKTSPRGEAFFDLETLSFPLTVRNRRPGDRFVPLGMEGAQKVKDFFINIKVPPTERDRTPLFWSGERLIWVGGHRIHDAVKVSEQTRRVLKIQLLSPDIKD